MTPRDSSSGESAQRLLRQCGVCGASNSLGATVCRDCGTPLPRVCGECRTENPAAARFCSQCGVRLHREQGFGDSSLAPLVDYGERRQLTVVFCDLVESTALSERLDPEDLLVVVRRYQQIVTDVVHRYAGHVAQYLGDGVLIYFGYPRAHEDDGRRAVIAGLEIVRAVGGLSAALAKERGVSIAVRIGVHTGPVVAAEIGDGAQLALGSTPNIAARVQTLAVPGEVLLTAASHALVERFVECTRLGPRALRGVSEPVVLFRALQPARADRAGRPTSDAERTPFVGRDDELDLLLARYRDAEDARGQAVLVTGEAGLGKSRLLQEVQRRTDGVARWFRCWCSPYDQNTSLFSVIDLLERSLELGRSDDSADRLQTLKARLEVLGFDAPNATSLLGTLLSLPVEAQEVAELGPTARARTFALLVDLVRYLARRTPVVFAVEDLHWADPSTLDFLALLIQSIGSDRVLVVLTGRPEFEVTWPVPAHQTSIQLQRLSERHAAQLVSEWSTGRGLPAEISRAVIEKTEGVPLFLEELTKAVIDTGLVARQATGLIPEPDLGQVIPNSLRDSLTARLDALGGAKETAQLGAVLGPGFRPEMLEAVGSIDQETMRVHLAQLVSSGMLYRVGDAPDDRYFFKHALIQDTAYETLLKSRQRQLHDRVVHVLRERSPSAIDDDPEMLARHCEEAGRISEAIDAFERAGARATARWAYVEASRSLRKALVLIPRLEPGNDRDRRELNLLEALQAPLFATRGYTAPELPGIYSRIRSLAKMRGAQLDEFALLYRSWAFHCVHGDRRETLEAADEIRETWLHSEPATRALAAWSLGATAFYSGQHGRALELLNHSVEYYRSGVTEASVAVPLFLASLTRGWALALAGYPVQSLSALEEAVAAAEGRGNPFEITQALTHLLIAEYDLGCDSNVIQEHASRALAISADRQLPQTLHSAQAHLGWAAAAQGDDRGIAEVREAVAGMRAMGTLNPVGTLVALLADALIRLGRDAEAFAAVDECLAECGTNLACHHEPAAHLLKGALLSQRGDRTAAEVCLRTALQLAKGQDAKLFELRAATGLARLMAEDGRLAEGREHLNGIYEWFREGLDTCYLRQAKVVLDELSLGQKRPLPLA